MSRVTDLTLLSGSPGAGATSDEAQSRSLTARAHVAIAPTAETDDLQVVIRNLSGVQGVTVPAGSWWARPDGTLPALDTVCCVTFDDLGDAWVGSHWSPVAS